MATTFRSPILLAHTHRLSALACSATGTHLVTASERGTLLRVWDTARGALESELRRGVDPAEIWGVLFEDSVFDIPLSDPDRRREHAKRKGGRVVGWSDKGTVHVWGGDPPKAPSKRYMLAQSSLTSAQDLLLPKCCPKQWRCRITFPLRHRSRSTIFHARTLTPSRLLSVPLQMRQEFLP